MLSTDVRPLVVAYLVENHAAEYHVKWFVPKVTIGIWKLFAGTPFGGGVHRSKRRCCTCSTS